MSGQISGISNTEDNWEMRRRKERKGKLKMVKIRDGGELYTCIFHSSCQFKKIRLINFSY